MKSIAESLILILSFLLFPGLSASVAAEVNLLNNPGFDEGLEGWTVYAPTGRIEPVGDSDDPAVRIIVGATDTIGHPHVYQTFSAAPGDVLEATALIRTASAYGGKGPYLSFSFFGESPERLSFTQSESTLDFNQWTEVRLQSVVPEGAVRAGFALILHGHGSVEFGSASVRLHPGVPPPVTGSISQITPNPRASFSLFGFGAEDDGWFYNADNLGRGYTAEEVRLREDRVRDLSPDWVRMFFWIRDWNPSGDWKTFDFTNDNMQSHYRTLDLYQAMGKRVTVVGVEWGVKEPFSDPELVATGYAALLHHLIIEKGYTCVRDWTLSNEPNHLFPRLGYTYEDFRNIHLSAHKAFRDRGLEIDIVGSDDAQDFLWFSKCLEDEEHRNILGSISSHRYFVGPDRTLAPFFFEERRAAIEKSGARLPFLLAEFGFQDGRSGTFENPIMRTFDYALWTTRLAIEGLNQGAAGFSIWCLQEVTYPGGTRMTYGLWDDQDRGWKLRPVYYSWRNFCRLTDPGDVVIPCVSEGGFIHTARVGDHLFWVNESMQEEGMRLTDLRPVSGRSWTEAEVVAEKLEGSILPVESEVIHLPARSFGWVQLESD